MMTDIRSSISKAETLARANRVDEAEVIADKLVAQYPSRMEVWVLHGYLAAREGDFEKAIDSLTRAISICAEEPSLFYDRGRYQLTTGDNNAAISDFSKGLDLCDRYDNDYYRASLHFHRAEALLGIGKKSDAMADLSHVPAEFKCWTTRLRSREELMEECSSE